MKAYLVLFSFVLLFACKTEPAVTTNETTVATETWTAPRVPDWHKNAVMYEANVRHMTPEGTFSAMQTHLPRLAEMGIDILWLQPVHPISEKNRKGGLGSPYSVADYYAVNPDFGTMDDFKAFLAAAKTAGLKVIIDWVPNHTGWDNPWISEHPEYYTKNDAGEIIDPIDYNTGESWGWTDVADLNYDNPATRTAMIDAMRFWTNEVGVDGFRVDVAHGVPVDFWETAADSLYTDQPVYLFAEAEVPALRNTGAYISDYGWEMHHTLNDIAKSRGANRDETIKLVNGNPVNDAGETVALKNATHIDSVLAKKAEDYQRGYAVQFTSNHDENAWAGTEFARMGDGHQAFAVLTATFDGMPLIYMGQESAIDRQFEFFEKDQLEWGDYKYADFYQTLFDLKDRNQALWNGEHGGALVKIPTGKDEMVYAFTREKNGDRVVVLINLSGEAQSIELGAGNYAGRYSDVFAQTDTELNVGQEINLDAWAYRVLEKQ